MYLYEVSEALPHVERLVHSGALDLCRLVGNIFSRVPVDKFALLEFLVESGERESEHPAAENRDTEHGSDDAVGLAVPILGQIPDVGAGNIAQLGKGVDGGQSNCTLGGRSRER